MSGGTSQYARNIARLSARIFGEPIPSSKNKGKHIFAYLGTEPYYKQRNFTHYYPPVQDVRDFFKELRRLGLYIDEHMDFREEMERQRVLRGKGKHRKQMKQNDD